MKKKKETKNHSKMTGEKIDARFWKRGEIYLIRTVTNYVLGRIVDLNERWILLEDAAWVASMGRFSEAMKTGKLDEVEPMPDGVWIVGVGSVVDGGPWKHGLRREVL